MDTGDALIIALGIVWLCATIGCLLSILIELVWWLWKGCIGVVVIVEEESPDRER